MDRLSDIESAQQETADALTRLFQKGSISFGSTRELGMSLRSLEIGSTLSIPELLHIASLLENVARVKNFGRKDREDAPDDSLTPLFSSLEPLTQLSREIYRCIVSEEEISDDASPGLKHVRRSMAVTAERIHSQLNSMVNGSLHSYLQDALVTTRNGRYCLPVKAEYRSQVPGMIHDQSSTGSTIFIEPAAVVSLNKPDAGAGAEGKGRDRKGARRAERSRRGAYGGACGKPACDDPAGFHFREGLPCPGAERLQAGLQRGS